MDAALKILPPRETCGNALGWFVHTIDEHQSSIEQVYALLPYTSKLQNAPKTYRRPHRSLLRAIIKHFGYSVKSKRATYTKKCTQFWCLLNPPQAKGIDLQEDKKIPESPAVAEFCVNQLKTFLGPIIWRRTVFIVPDAGSSKICTLLPRGRRVATDSEVSRISYLQAAMKTDRLVCGNFLDINHAELGLYDEVKKIGVPKAILCVVSQQLPPNLLEFLSHAADLADTVIVQVPKDFNHTTVDNRWHLQTTVNMPTSPAVVFSIFQIRYTSVLVPRPPLQETTEPQAKRQRV
jgi:hypothetical protein